MAAVGITQRVLWNAYAAVGLTARALWDVAAPAPAASAVVYDDGRCGPFARVDVDHLVLGASRVSWRLRDSFQAPGPYSYQLQVGSTGLPQADDWVAVGPPAENAFQATDPERRAFGKQLTVHYRVALSDADGTTYYSPPASVLGGLGAREWAVAKEIVRKWRLRAKAWAGVRGFLLKRRRDGVPCTRCLDQDTGEVTDSHCPICLGTRYVTGYFRSVPETYSDLGLEDVHEARVATPEGWSLPTAVTAVFLGSPLLSSGDLWVNADSDGRYYVESIKALARVRGLPVVSEAVLRLLPFSDVAYRIPLEGT